ncbi:hypothetical protein GWK47_052983 [Chionoecetes opilio]|uniref:Uncharacterized protein n=1 Tax=Chionoecetes opilio TaxID=41210 RepID=A0A8J4Y7H7_CHIOP|nr:hypothetical protein GWK47_052983 [Chionoecetes opilio]
MLGLLTGLSLFWSGTASRFGGNPGMPGWLSSGAKTGFTWMKAGLDPAECGGGYHQCDPGVLSVRAPRPRVSGPLVASTCEGCFPGCPRLSAKAPRAGETGKGGALSPGLSGRKHPPLAFRPSSVLATGLPPPGIKTSLSPASRAVTAPWLFGARPFGARQADRQQIPGFVPFDFGGLVGPSLQQCLASTPPPIGGAFRVRGFWVSGPFARGPPTVHNLSSKGPLARASLPGPPVRGWGAWSQRGWAPRVVRKGPFFAPGCPNAPWGLLLWAPFSTGSRPTCRESLLRVVEKA